MRQKGRVGGAGILKELSSARGKTQDSVMVRLPGLYGNKKKNIIQSFFLGILYH